MNTADLLIELGTEELPPKALTRLSNAFGKGVEEGLKQANIPFEKIQVYSAPRRLAIIVKSLAASQPDQDVEKRGPAVQAAFDEAGCPSKAAEGFARGCGVKVDELETIETDKGAWLVFRKLEKGQSTAALIGEIINQSLASLPIPKRMRWGGSDVEFVRPVHWLIVLHGEQVVDVNVLGQQAANKTYGHRFHHPQAIEIKHADEYVGALKNTGYVIVDPAERQAIIKKQAIAAADALGGFALIDDDLLTEVTSLVEWPVAVAGDFDPQFLEVPAEALISSMQDHQKYFPVIDNKEELLPHFITISNIDSKDMSQVKAGNERVISPRLSDAVFFWTQDRKIKLEDRIASLESVVFQKKLGTLAEKSKRVAVVAKAIAEKLGADVENAERAALLSKCDLMTEMVFEFTDLQGIMGRYYAALDGEHEDVAAALDEQYMPRFAGDELPSSVTGQIVSVSDKLDTILGIFAIGQKPTGEKDPFALRRATLGVLRIMIEKNLDLDLQQLLEIAAQALNEKADANAAISDVIKFMLERLRAFFADKDISADIFDAVLVCQPTRPVDFSRRIEAVNVFKALPEAESLAAANKRISNILKKVEGEILTQVNESLLQEKAEKELYSQVSDLTAEVNAWFASGDYQSALTKLSALKNPVDQFFDDVMVMADDAALKNNRIALLKQISDLFLQAADLSRLQ
ncbi:MAG: glycine--tRNA ligase subunit beta [Gammaproteobacteria bacterium]|nr:glycine--tRNA ligase subunit beta [Gammaproteobacteria bacterium]